MSEYTPTTEEVREQFWVASGTRRRDPEAWDEFDRWLAAHDAAVQASLHIVPCARCGEKPVVANDAVNSDIVVCGDCGVQIGLSERAGVVAEEPEWEYGILSPLLGVHQIGSREKVDRAVQAFAVSGAPVEFDRGERIVRRIKQGPWVPVEQGETDA